ncbi:heme oxygenase [Frankia sp. CcI49]|uniref:DUF3050 domain-containing protein n=1 Tax=Frankia sp. R43 TaxID=269536 RepID=UPI0006CA3145|nr:MULTISPECIES: DUF3050 domain-containing protein [unclassified Frankia]KPM55095.1 heme oxygenase [Frankia sp. R43]ONH56257.1 heme oxygenase [Frankia sp. CcI49]
MPSRYSWGGAHPSIVWLTAETAPVRDTVLAHPVYARLVSPDDVTAFMTSHVFAVWDFMSLLKSLQRTLTCVDVPWTPTVHRACRRLINEIVLVEESDEYGGSYISHFELYLEAMEQAGADTGPIRRFLDELAAGTPVPAAITRAAVPAPAAAFVRATWDLLATAAPHALAAAFAFGREDLIPEMFTQVLAGNVEMATFRDYLARHVAVDGEQHTPMAMEMLVALAGDDPRRWRECADVVRGCLQARAALWDGIAATLPDRQPVSR